MKIIGRIEFWNPDRGYGFIFDADGVKRFFHKTHIISGTPVTGRLCQYEAGRNSKGLMALEVEIFGSSSAPIIAGLDGAR